jgi:hypothetical protein
LVGSVSVAGSVVPADPDPDDPDPDDPHPHRASAADRAIAIGKRSFFTPL